MPERIDPITVIYNSHLNETENREAAEIAMMRKLQSKYLATGWPKCDTCKMNLNVTHTTGIKKDWTGPYGVTVSSVLSCGNCK